MATDERVVDQDVLIVGGPKLLGRGSPAAVEPRRIQSSQTILAHLTRRPLVFRPAGIETCAVLKRNRLLLLVLVAQLALKHFTVVGPGKIQPKFQTGNTLKLT